MGMRDDADGRWELIANHFTGDSSPDERMALERWIEESPANAKLVSGLRQAGEMIRPPRLAPLDVAAEQRAVAQRIGVGHAGSRARSSRIVPRAASGANVVRRIVLGVSAVAAATAIIVAGLRQTAPSLAMSGRMYSTDVAQHASVTLSDGSRITLAPQSRLRVADGFGRDTRSVTLDGEAYFEVASAAGAPFVVHTGTVATRVLGTGFVVRRYPTDASVSVAVLTGKVVTGARRHVTLTAGSVARLTDSTATTLVRGDMHEYTAWTRGQLVFENAPVPEMLATIGRWYGYEFRLADSALANTVAHARVTAAFRIGRPEETLLALQDVINVTLTFEKTVVTLHARSRSGAVSRRDKMPSIPMERGK
jgi:transmembrane sensor